MQVWFAGRVIHMYVFSRTGCPFSPVSQDSETLGKHPSFPCFFLSSTKPEKKETLITTPPPGDHCAHTSVRASNVQASSSVSRG